MDYGEFGQIPINSREDFRGNQRGCWERDRKDKKRRYATEEIKKEDLQQKEKDERTIL